MPATAPRRFTHLVRAALCAGVALAATACGPFSGASGEADGPFPGMSGPEIADTAAKATAKATSLTVDFAGDTTDGNIKAYMAIDSQGDCKGTLTMGGTGTAELVRAGDTAYMRFDEAFLRSQNEGGTAEENAEVLKTLKGRWLKEEASSPEAKEQLEFCELDTFLGEFREGFHLMRRGETTTLQGKQVVVLTEKDGDASYKVYVAAEGEPYVLKVEQKGGEEPATMTFTDFNKPLGPIEPAAKDVIDLHKTRPEQ
ncbi:hypothetical protein QFZ82_004800 [Streptomyces sp. V4I23]|uniref:hypothetical protein n=1 Tax=Streptomyces sp. V4I23 TaxID=3042282 RepID=UPI0027881027|nr:hypothetical protein [Streptomyces sp. V4I23]MDQ1010315.1 hypothetical protein [Streptomyces sp. V4I23]